MTDDSKASVLSVAQFREQIWHAFGIVCSRTVRGDDYKTFVDQVDLLAARYAEARQASAWQPISLAPKDGTAVLGYFPQRQGFIARQDVVPIFWRGNEWANSTSGHAVFDQPTLFQLLPLAPPVLEDDAHER